ncbi:hypothetical protein VPH35_113299 [Triticum aestivum]
MVAGKHGARRLLPPPSTTQRGRTAALPSGIGYPTQPVNGPATATAEELLPSASASRRCTGARRCLSLSPGTSEHGRAAMRRQGPGERRGGARLSGGVRSRVEVAARRAGQAGGSGVLLFCLR